MTMSAAAWAAYARMGNVQETWVFKLYYGAGTAHLAISDRDLITAGYQSILGCVRNVPSIRRSIDIVKCSSSRANVTLELDNINFRGAPLSDELTKTGSTTAYMNRNVVISSFLNGDGTAAVTLFTGRLKGISWDSDSIQLDIEEHFPWDDIKIPSVKSTVTGKYFPVAYGNFNPNASTDTTRAYNTSFKLFPVPVEYAGYHEQAALVGHSIAADGRLHVYEEGIDQFCPLYKYSDESFADTSAAYGDGYKIEALGTIMAHSAKFKAQHSDDASDTFTNPHNAFDSLHADDDNDTYAYDTLADGDEGFLYFTFPGSAFKIRNDITISARVRGTVTSGNTPSCNLILEDADGHSHGSEAITLNGTNVTKTYSISGAGAEPDEYYYFKVATGVVAGTPEIDFRIYDVRIQAAFELDMADAPAEGEKLNDLDTLYCGAPGLPNSWDASAISKLHHMHRDLMCRFAGYTTTEPTGWTDLDARTNYDCYWWATDPVPLLDVLDQAQFEGHFIFCYTPAGGGRYIFVDQTGYAAGDVAATLVELDDTTGFSYSYTPISECVTKMTINSLAHPADSSRYKSSLTTTDSTSRTAWNIDTSENAVVYDLTMADNTPGTWDDYITLVTGSPKKIIKTSILNPKHHLLEVGDIVKFTPMTGTDAAYYMIIEERRSPGKLDITAREVDAS